MIKEVRLPRVSRVGKRPVQREAIAQEHVVAILLKQSLRLSLLVFGQVVPPLLEDGGVGEHFACVFLFRGDLFFGLLFLPRRHRLYRFLEDVGDFSLGVPVLLQKFLHGVLLSLKLFQDFS